MDLLLSLDRAASQSLRDQLYAGLRAAILDGRAPGGSRLPATRTLAKELGVSRLTVEDAYARLIAEGYVAGRQGSGTYVAAHVTPDPKHRFGRDVRSTSGAGTRDHDATRPWSTWARRAAAVAAPIPPGPAVPYDFRQGMPALDAFPVANWNQIRAREARAVTVDRYHYGPSAGDPWLQDALSRYLTRARGLRCEPDQIVVTSGTQQGLDLLVRLWIEPGDVVAMEEPGYPAARRILAAAGTTILPVPVDSNGLIIDALDAAESTIRDTSSDRRVRLVYVTPSHQYPTGGVMALERRLALLSWARARGAIVLEDDYDAEFRYGIRPVEALAGLDAAVPGPGAAVYVGTLSKVLFPALRLGYLVLPPDMVPTVVAARSLSDRQTPTLDQRTLAAFIDEGHFERHLAKMRRLYAARRAAAIESLNQELPGLHHRDPAATAAGLHLLVGFETQLTEEALLARCLTVGVMLDPAGPCFTVPPPHPAVMLGYASLAEPDIREGIRRIGTVLRSVGVAR